MCTLNFFCDIIRLIEDYTDMDLELLGLINDFLTQNGLSTSVLTGKTAFHTELKSK